jgi:hypothetical protein
MNDRSTRPETPFLVALALGACFGAAACGPAEETPPEQPVAIGGFTALQPDVFADPGAWPNAWADFDGDGDPDLFVGFSDRPNRLYRNDRGTFRDVAEALGLAVPEPTRAAAWGDYDLDGDPDLYVGFGADGPSNRLYRNDRELGFVDATAEVGLDHAGETRQPAFIDYDGDGDLDLFVAFRDGPNRLARNDGGTFTDVTEASGIGDPRRTVGAAWFDMDGDADLDLFVANQEGDEDGFFRNRGDGTFEDVAPALGMSQPGRTEEQGSVGVALGDYDNDGDVDVFVASYGADVLWQNQGDGTYTNVAAGTALAGDHHSVAAAWGDRDNDGWLDLYVGTFLSAEPEAADYLFRNDAGTFVDDTPEAMRAKGASHGVAWADYDIDGDLDLALANVTEGGSHPLYRNELDPVARGRSLHVVAADGQGRWTRAGARITLRSEQAGWVTTRVLDSGGGYNAQGLQPAHFGIPPDAGLLSVTVTWFERGEARSTTASGVDPARFRTQWLVLRLGVQGGP